MVNVIRPVVTKERLKKLEEIAEGLLNPLAEEYDRHTLALGRYSIMVATSASLALISLIIECVCYVSTGIIYALAILVFILSASVLIYASLKFKDILNVKNDIARVYDRLGVIHDGRQFLSLCDATKLYRFYEKVESIDLQNTNMKVTDGKVNLITDSPDFTASWTLSYVDFLTYKDSIISGNILCFEIMDMLTDKAEEQMEIFRRYTAEKQEREKKKPAEDTAKGTEYTGKEP